MPVNDFIIPLALVPLCSLLNHLGGQSLRIANPRITCRVFGMGAAFGIVSLLCGFNYDNAALYAALVTAGMALWAVFKWGPMFMAINGEDMRLYGTSQFTPDHWITKMVDCNMGINKLTSMTAAECREWGALYGTYRGILMLPMFIVMGFYITPWAFPIGIFCITEGFVYYLCPTVERAEYWFGALIGMALAAVLIMRTSDIF